LNGKEQRGKTTLFFWKGADMPTKMKPRQRRILQALKDLGGRATQREITHTTDMSVNGVSQSLGAMQVQGYVALVEWTKKDAT
jgi:predicted transcriptional regulator